LICRSTVFEVRSAYVAIIIKARARCADFCVDMTEHMPRNRGNWQAEVWPMSQSGPASSIMRVGLPKMSTGDRTILGRIAKRGNSYLRTLFMQAARVMMLRRASWPKHGFGIWLARAAQRLHPNVLAAALASKLARIAWTVLAQERSYEARIMKAAA
jgi:hypothetical protein